MKSTCHIKGIGTKNYGSCNGIIYTHRRQKNYYDKVAVIEAGYKEPNSEWKREWGRDYIDLLTPAMIDSTLVRVFADDRRVISQDCRHLTPAGARWYAKMLNWGKNFA